MDPYSRGQHPNNNGGYDQQQYPPQYGSNNQQYNQQQQPPPQYQQPRPQAPNYNQGGYPPQQRPRGPPTNYQGGPPPNAQNRNPNNSNWPRGPPPPNQMHGGGPPMQGRGPPQSQQQRGPPPQQYNYQQQNSFGSGGATANQNYQNQAPPQNPQQQNYQQQPAAPDQQQYQQEEPYPEAPLGTVPKGPFDPEISDIELNEKYNRVTNHSSNILNLLMIFEKQLATAKGMSQATTNFKETTKSIFHPQHHYFNESCRIVDVHGMVAQMYQRYIPELEQTVMQVRSWSNKYNILSDMKKNRDKASTDFNKKHIAYEKKRAANTSQAPAKLAEIQKLEREAKISMTFLDTQNQQLINLYDELMKDKHEVLNKIVADYMFKSFHFHKKANQQFQTLSSIDTDGHKTAELLYQKDVKDRHLHMFTVLNQESQEQNATPAQQYDQGADYQQNTANPNQTHVFYSQQPQNYDVYQDQQQYGGSNQEVGAANYDYGAGSGDQNQYDYNDNQQNAYVDPNLQFYSQGGADDAYNNYGGNGEDATGITAAASQQQPEPSYIQHVNEFSTNTNPLDTNTTAWQSQAVEPIFSQSAAQNPPPSHQAQQPPPSNAVLDLDDIFGTGTIPSAAPARQQPPAAQQFQPQAPAQQQPRGPPQSSSNPLDDIFANPGPSAAPQHVPHRASVDTQSFNFGAPSSQPQQQFRPQAFNQMQQPPQQRPPPQQQFNPAQNYQQQQMPSGFPPQQQQQQPASTGDPFADLFSQNLNLKTNQPQSNPQHRPQPNQGGVGFPQQQQYNQHQTATNQMLPGSNPFADM